MVNMLSTDELEGLRVSEAATESDGTDARIAHLEAENARLREVEIKSLEAECVAHIETIEQLRALIAKHNDECRECPVIE